MNKRFEVSASWMSACGMGNEAKTFPVIRIEDFVTDAFLTLDLGDGYTWIVNARRGKFV